MLLISARFTIQSGKREEFVKLLQEEGILAETKKAAGNRGYDYYYPVDSDEDVFLIEKWSTKEAWDAHKVTSRAQKFQDIKGNYVLSMIPELYETK